MEKTRRANKTLGLRSDRGPPITEPFVMIYLNDVTIRAPNTSHLPAAISTVIKGPMAGATTALVRNDHFLNEISLHDVPRNNAGGMGEITRVTNKKCCVVYMDLSVTMISRSRSIRGAILRYFLEVKAPASTGFSSRGQAVFNNAASVAPMRCVPDEAKE